MLHMEAIAYVFLGLEALRVACICFRKSFLMLASNFLVGTLFSSSRFSLASTRVLRRGIDQLKTQLHVSWLRCRMAKLFERSEQFMDEAIIRSANNLKPRLATIRALILQSRVTLNRNNEARIAFRAFKLKPCNVLDSDTNSLLCGHAGELL